MKKKKALLIYQKAIFKAGNVYDRAARDYNRAEAKAYKKAESEANEIHKKAIAEAKSAYYKSIRAPKVNGSSF